MAPVDHGGLEPPRPRHTLPGRRLQARWAACPWEQSPRTPSSPRHVTLDVELVSALLLIPTAVSSRQMSRLWSSSVSLKKSLHDPCVPLILEVDSVLSGTSHPAHLGRHARQVELVADPSECSHHPVQLILILCAVSPGPSVLRVLNASPARLVTCVPW